MNSSNNQIVAIVLKAMLDGQMVNRKNYNNGSLHTWISSLRNEHYIPIETDTKDSDGTCNYYMLPEEIIRFFEPELRLLQKQEQQSVIEVKRQQCFIKQFLRFLKNLNEYPSLWGYWDELPFKLDEMAKEINALLNGEKSVNQKTTERAN